jgi:glycosyltransferase involved in cell wall biosynthesis
MFKPIVSVIMPAYNTENTIFESIKSILNQTYKNIELIIINDGSSDNTIEFISKIKDERIKIINNELNLGISKSLNIGILASNGDFIARMDSDDIAYSDRIQKQLKVITSMDIDILGAEVDTFGKFPSPKYSYPKTNKQIYYYSLLGNPIAHPTVLAKSIFFKQNLYNADAKFTGFEDYELWTRSIQNNYTFFNMPDKLLAYRLKMKSKTSIDSINFKVRYLDFKYHLQSTLSKKLDPDFIYLYSKLINQKDKKMIDKIFSYLKKNNINFDYRTQNQIKIILNNDYNFRSSIKEKLYFHFF